MSSLRSFARWPASGTVIVYGYLDVDSKIVHRLLNERLDDFAEFALSVNQYLSENR